MNKKITIKSINIGDTIWHKGESKLYVVIGITPEYGTILFLQEDGTNIRYHIDYIRSSMEFLNNDSIVGGKITTGFVNAKSIINNVCEKSLEIKPKGGASSYYDLPEGAKTLQDLIEHRNMNGSCKDIFKACYRLGNKDGMSDIDDVTKMAYYSLRELGRLRGTKDYIALAESIIGSQSIKDNKDI